MQLVITLVILAIISYVISELILIFIKPAYLYYSFDPLFVCIEGLDGSGKFTISNELKKQIEEVGLKVLVVSFPMYEKWHSKLVRLYLGGFFGKDPNKVNPYIASFFYSVDRFFAWHYGLKSKVFHYDIVIFDRYTSSNIVYQGSKMKTEKQMLRLEKFVNFLEFKLFRLPVPEKMFVLSTNSDVSVRNMIHSRDKLDIHESLTFLDKVYNAVTFYSKKNGWKVVTTTDRYNNMRNPYTIVDEEIIQDVMLQYYKKDDDEGETA